MGSKVSKYVHLMFLCICTQRSCVHYSHGIDVKAKKRAGKRLTSPASSRENLGSRTFGTETGSKSVVSGKGGKYSPSELGSVVAGGRSDRSELAGMDDEARAEMEELLALKQVDSNLLSVPPLLLCYALTSVDLQEAALQARGRLWWREPLDDGGELVERYAVLSKGRLDLYANEEVRCIDFSTCAYCSLSNRLCCSLIGL